MNEIRSLRSPDGRLTLVCVEVNGTVSIGFRESGWHVHPDMIGEVFYHGDEMSASQALDALWKDIVEDRMVIAVDIRDAVVVHAEVMPDVSSTAQALHSGSRLRYWSGRVFSRP